MTSSSSSTHIQEEEQDSGPIPKKKNMFQRINQDNKSVGLVFGGITGLVCGIILVLEQTINVAVIGIPSTLAWRVFAVILTMCTGCNLGCYFGHAMDEITADNTIFDFIFYICRSIKQCFCCGNKKKEARP